MENSYGVYASFKLPSGELVSVNRETVAEVEEDVDLLFGSGKFKTILQKLGRTATPETVQPQPQDPPVGDISSFPSESNGVSPIQQNPTMDDVPQSFEVCGDCGTMKDIWKPPGISKAGKSYSGFWSCPNWKNHK